MKVKAISGNSVHSERVDKPSVHDGRLREILPLPLPSEPYVSKVSGVNLKRAEPSKASKPLADYQHNEEFTFQKDRFDKSHRASFNNNVSATPHLKSPIRDSHPITQPETPKTMSIYRDQVDGYESFAGAQGTNFCSPRVSSSNWKQNSASSPFIRRTPDRSTNAYLNSGHRQSISDSPTDPRWLASHNTLHNRKSSRGRPDISPKAITKTGDQKRFEDWSRNNCVSSEATVSCL